MNKHSRTLRVCMALVSMIRFRRNRLGSSGEQLVHCSLFPAHYLYVTWFAALSAVSQVWPGSRAIGFPAASVNVIWLLASALLQFPGVTVPFWNTNACPLPMTLYWL